MIFEPKSSNVEKVSYDPLTSQLSVKFKSSKKVYVHTKVPQHVFDNLTKADSAGSFYHSVVKGYKLL